MAIFGYARVSTRDQDLAGQLAELQAAGCGNIFKEKASGARTDRPELAKAIRRLEAGDLLVVTRLDRLARSTRDLLNILDAVGKAGAGFKSLMQLPVAVLDPSERDCRAARRPCQMDGAGFTAARARGRARRRA